MKKIIVAIFFTAVSMAAAMGLHAQDSSYDVFNPISKYLAAGDADSVKEKPDICINGRLITAK